VANPICETTQSIVEHRTATGQHRRGRGL